MKLLRIARQSASELGWVALGVVTLVVLPAVGLGWAAWLAAWLLGLGAHSAAARGLGGSVGLLLGVWVLCAGLSRRLDDDGDDDDGEEDERQVIPPKREQAEPVAWVN